MTVLDLHNTNEKFQKSAVMLSELIPSGGLTNATSAVIRSSRKIDFQFAKLLAAPSEMKFNMIMDKLEEEMDEVMFILDRLEEANKKRQIVLIKDFLKEGYDLLSLYSRCFDSIIDKKVYKEE
jgi:hypothetical protein